jgi:hypothetical protein
MKAATSGWYRRSSYILKVRSVSTDVAVRERVIKHVSSAGDIEAAYPPGFKAQVLRLPADGGKLELARVHWMQAAEAAPTSANCGPQP